MTEDDLKFAIALDGSVSVDGTTVQEAGASDILDELPPAGDPPENPEIAAMRARLEELEAFSPLIAAIGKGEVEVRDAAPPGPDPVVIAGYRQRVSAPDALEIAADMRLFQERLSPEDAQRLEEDPAFFNETFDKFRALRPAAQPVRAVPDRRQFDSLLAAKESRKDAARTMPAGAVNGSETFGGGHQERGQAAEIERAKAAIRRAPSSTEAGVRLAKAMGLVD